MNIKNLLWIVLFVYEFTFGQALPRTTNENTCTPKSAGNPSIDDVPAISEALAKCGNGGTIIIPAGQIFTIRSPLYFRDCIGCDFQIEGTLKISDDVDYWQTQHSVFHLNDVEGAIFHSSTGSGLIDGSGQKFWDAFAVNETLQRPTLIVFDHCSNVTFTQLKLINAPMFFIVTTNNSIDLTFSYLVLNAVSTSPNRPANTDGIDTSQSSYITIKNNYITNGDDCVAFKNGSNYITVENITCIGSHGLSVGSLGLTPDHRHSVNNIYVSNAKMINNMVATRIKFYPAGPPHGPVFVSNVTYKDMTIENTDLAVQIDSCYQTDPNFCKQYPSSAQLLNINFINITGTTSQRYDPYIGKIFCPPNGTCDLTFNQWNVRSPTGGSSALCSHYEHPSGITCKTNAFHWT